MNYKDGLAVTGKGPVVRRFPMIAGVDLAGQVEALVASGLEAGRPRDRQRLGSRRDPSRCFAEKARVNGDWLVPVPFEMRFA